MNKIQIMLTDETQQMLCNLFITLAKGERNIRITRQVLSNTFDFSPYNIFSYLSNNESQFITCEDIYNYLNSKNIPISIEECKLILLFYDKNLDNVLTYKEFFNFIHNDKSKYNNPDFILQKKPSISSNIEFLLLKLFMKEIELAKKIIINLKKLRFRPDFDIHIIFHYITKSNFINLYCMQKFFEKNYNDFLESDLKNIIKKLDINKDGTVDLREFYALLEFPKSCNNLYTFIPCNICTEKFCDQCLYKNKNEYIVNNNKNYINNNKHFEENVVNNIYLKENTNNKYIKENNHISNASRNNYNIRSINCCSSKDKTNENNINNNNNILSKTHSQFKKHLYLNDNINFNCNTNYKTHKHKKIYENKIEENKKNYNSPLIKTLRSKISFLQNKKDMEENPHYKIYPQNILSPTIKRSYINIIDSYLNSDSDYYDVEKFNNLLKVIMEKEIEIEKEKINFMKNTNLSFKDLFYFFDKDKKDYISIQDLYNGFDILEINQNGDEPNLFMNRYDLLGNKKLCQLDFFDAVVPFEKEYRINMENKSFNYIIKQDNVYKNKLNLYYMKKLFTFIIDKENEINQIKRSYYDIKDKIPIIFNIIDKDKKGYLLFSDLNTYMENNKLIFDNYAIALLFIRLDKKREGKIKILELIEEFKSLDI